MIRRGTYGAAKTDSTSSDSYAGSDNGDEGSLWSAEKMPLLSIKQKEAKILGAKRMISHTTVERSFSIDVDTLIDHDTPGLSWTWQRKLKVAILTLTCILVTVFLLILPEARYNSAIVTVSERKPLIYDLDMIYAEKKRSNEKILRVTLMGSFVDKDFSQLAPDQLTVTPQPENITGLNLTSLPEPWVIGLIPPVFTRPNDESVEKHQFDIGDLNLDDENATLTIVTTSKESVPLTVKIELVSSLVDIDIILGALILVILYILIIFEVAHRTVIIQDINCLRIYFKHMETSGNFHANGNSGHFYPGTVG